MTFSAGTPASASGNGHPGAERPRWWIYRGTGEPLHDTTLAELLPQAPPWRRFTGAPALPSPPPDEEETVRRLGARPPARALSEFARREAEMVNAALLLRRPLLVIGRPGTGKSSLAYRVSRELRLGRVLRWHISSRTTLQRGLYEYDAIGRVQDSAALRAAATGADAWTTPAATPPAATDGAAADGAADRAADAVRDPGSAPALPPDVGDYIQLGPLGTALLPYDEPRVLLVDELDKSDLDLANDLLSVFEEGSYPVPELLRARRRHPSVTVLTDDPSGEAEIVGGRVTCRAFPFVVMTSNSEREFPPAFLRRCLVLRMPEPDEQDLAHMLAAHFDEETAERFGGPLIAKFLARSREQGGLSIDQLLNSLYIATSYGAEEHNGDLLELAERVWHRLDGSVVQPGTAGGAGRGSDG